MGGTVVYSNEVKGLTMDYSLISLLEIFLTLAALIFLYAKKFVNKLISLSLIGFLVTFYFVLKQAPDVAITQMVVEVATLFVFVLLLIKTKPESKGSIEPIRIVLAVASGFTIASFPFFQGVLGEGDGLGLFYLDNTLDWAFGANAVNTILVDFRGLDTLGEISVIVVAALGVASLLLKKNMPLIYHDRPIIPTPVLGAVMPTIFGVAFAFSLYLLVRGHDYPGGGFAGGMNVAISLVLVSMCLQKSPIFFMDRLNPFYLMMGGLLLALGSGLISTLMFKGFMDSYFVGNVSMLGTPFLFDLGIFVLVIGSVTSILYVIRDNTVRGLS
jgi:multisubunit Na+/H+ antiporter MnhB subunit